jgi:hypothetical protein
VITNPPDRPLADIYENAESFEAYIASVRENRAEFIRRRELEAFWTKAIIVLTREIELSQKIGDVATCDELELMRSGYRERLGQRCQPRGSNCPEMQIAKQTGSGSLTVTEPGASGSVNSEMTSEDKAICPAELGEAREETIGACIELVDTNESDGNSMAHREAEPALLQTREEKKRKCDELLSRTRAIKEKLAALNRTNAQVPQPGRKLLLQLRAIGCDVEGAWAEAIASGVDGALHPIIDSIREAVDALRLEWNDSGASIPFDAGIRSGKKKGVSVTAWGELELRFAAAANTSDALDWLLDRWSELDESTLEPLLGSIAAASQLLRRATPPRGVWDNIQTEMYNMITSTTKDAGIYLAALNKDTPTPQLEKLATQLDDTTAAAKSDYEHKAVLRQREETKSAAYAAFNLLCTEFPELGGLRDRFTDDQSRLIPVLDQMIAAGIPPSDKIFRRSPFVENGTALLDGIVRFEKILKGVQPERARRGLDIPTLNEELEQPDNDNAPLVPREQAAVKAWLQGKSIMILGGVPKPETRDKLMQLLACDTVNWPKSSNSDAASKFRPTIEKSYILMVVKNFAGHDYSEKGKGWIKDAGGHFLLLRGGYGADQIIHQLYEHPECPK